MCIQNGTNDAIKLENRYLENIYTHRTTANHSLRVHIVISQTLRLVG